ncbi:MAG: hypothetical protein Q7V88_05145 [Actinomycetota bacterium]|nr:hypothetical protein [Actinomycetota bacterium]
MSITEITVAAGWMAGLAIVALIATGWRKPARAATQTARAPLVGRPRGGVRLAEVRAPKAQPTRWWQRLWALVASSVLALWVGAVVATVVGFGAAWAVITLTDMLKR